MSSQPKMVMVPHGALIFCRYTLAIMIWLALIFKLKWLVWVSLLILVLSAVLKVRRAPLILLYAATGERIFRSKDERLDETAMRFAHILGALLVASCLLLIYLINDRLGWGLVLIVAVVKTFGAIGFCPAYKLFGCLTAGGCCRLTGARK